MDWIKFKAYDTDTWPQFDAVILLYFATNTPSHQPEYYEPAIALQGDCNDDGTVGLMLVDSLGYEVDLDAVSYWALIEPPEEQA